MRNALIIGTNLSSYLLANELRKFSDINNIYISGDNIKQIGCSRNNYFISTKVSFDADVSNLVDLINKYDIELIIPGAHDIYLAIYSKVKDRLLGVTENESNFEKLHNKATFRKTISEISPENNPKFLIFSSGEVTQDYGVIDNIGIKACIGKPCHAGGGRGIAFIGSAAESNLYINSARGGIIEEVHNGTDLSISIFLDRDNASNINYYIDKEFKRDNEFKITASLTSYDLMREIKCAGVIESLAKISIALTVNKSIFMHFQIRYLNAQDWIIIEATERMPGDAYALLPEIYCGINYSKLYILKYLGLNSDFSNLLGGISYPKNFGTSFGRVCSSSGTKISGKLNIIFEYQSDLIKNDKSYSVKFFETDQFDSEEIRNIKYSDLLC